MPDQYGTDVSTFVDSDLDPYFREISGTRVVAEEIMRRWLTPQGALFWDPKFGSNIRDLLSARVDRLRLFSSQASLAAQAEQDERVASAAVSVSFDTSTKNLRVRAEILLVDGLTFELVADVSQLTFELLKPEA